MWFLDEDEKEDDDFIITQAWIMGQCMSLSFHILTTSNSDSNDASH